MAKKSPSAAAADSFNAMLGDLYTVDDSGDLVPFKGDAGITAAEIRAAKGAMPYQTLATSYPGPDVGVVRACEGLLSQGWTGTVPFDHDVSRLLMQWLKKNNVPFFISRKKGMEVFALADKKALARIIKP
jgi:hypothetical protein